MFDTNFDTKKCQSINLSIMCIYDTNVILISFQ